MTDSNRRHSACKQERRSLKSRQTAEFRCKRSRTADERERNKSGVAPTLLPESGAALRGPIFGVRCNGCRKPSAFRRRRRKPSGPAPNGEGPSRSRTSQPGNNPISIPRPAPARVQTSLSRFQVRLRSLPAQDAMLSQSAVTRSSPRDVHEYARDVTRRLMRTKAFLKSRNQRKRVEVRFAHLKTHHRFERIQLRGLSLAGVQLIIANHALGLPVFRALSLCTCRRHYPGAASGRIASLTSSKNVSAFPERVVGSACALSFSRIAQRSLALRPAHSRCHQFVTR